MGAEIPAADMDNVNIAGTSNGVALTYQILINTGADRPFRRSVMLVVLLIMMVVVLMMLNLCLLVVLMIDKV